MPYHLAMSPLLKKRRSRVVRLFFAWSGRRGSNSLPPPWQGGALPDELLPRLLYFSDFYIICNRSLFVKANSRKIFRSFPHREKRGRPAPPSSLLFSLELRRTGGPGERQHVPDVGDAGQVHHQPLKANAEARVLVAAKAPQVQVPPVVLLVEP